MDQPNAGFYEPSSNKTVNHIIKAVIFAVPAGTILFFVFTEVTHPAAYALGLLAWPFLAAMFRNLQALGVGPYLRLTSEALEVRYWEPVEFFSFAMFRPTYSIIEHSIPWSRYEGCNTYTHEVNGITNFKALIIETDYATYTIGWDIFRGSLDLLQNAILDFLQEQFHQPEREAMRVSEFCRERFSTPVRVNSNGPGMMLALLGLSAGSAAVVYTFVPSFPDTGWVFVPGVLLLGTAYTANEWFSSLKKRVLEFRSDGFAIGPSAEQLRLIPWDQILFARTVTKSESYNGATATEQIVSIEIRLRDRSTISLPSVYKRPLSELKEMLDPPLDKVQAAYERIDQGEDIETASVSAGLPACSTT